MLKLNEDRHAGVAAIVLIKAVPGQEKDAFRALKEVNGIKSLYHIFGDHDVFMVLESAGIASLERILDSIKEMPSVNSVKALLVEPEVNCSIDPICRKRELCFIE